MSWCCLGCVFQRGKEFGANHLRDRDTASNIADGVLHDVVRRLLAVVELITVQKDLEATLSNGREGDANFAVASGANLGCQTGSLPEIPSRNAVLDLQLSLTFGHVCRLLAHGLGLSHKHSRASRASGVGLRCRGRLGIHRGKRP